VIGTTLEFLVWGGIGYLVAYLVLRWYDRRSRNTEVDPFEKLSNETWMKNSEAHEAWLKNKAQAEHRRIHPFALKVGVVVGALYCIVHGPITYQDAVAFMRNAKRGEQGDGIDEQRP
jgi:hypothetical protein